MTAVQKAFSAATLLCLVYCSAAAMKVWPMIDGDGPAYFPPAVEWSLNRPLTNPVWPAPLNDSIDGPGGRRFIYHGFLYALTVGTAARLAGGGPEATVAAAYVLHGICAVVGAAAVLAWTAVRGPLRVLAAGILPLCGLALSVAWHGRVEPLAILIVALAVLAWRSRSEWRYAWLGGLSAAMAFTSPVCGVIGVAGLGAALAVDSAARARSVATLAAGFAVVAAAAIAIYPYPIGDWIGGVLRHGRINLSLAAGQGFVQTWIAAPELPVLGAVVAALGFLAASHFWRTVGKVTTIRRAMAIAMAGLFFAGVVRFAFVKTEASYNAVVWMPAIAAMAFAGSVTPRRALIAVTMCGLPVLGLVRSSAILAAQFRSTAVSFQEARTQVEPIVRRGGTITPGLWLAAGNVTSSALMGKDLLAAAIVARQESKTGLAQPPDLPGYVLTVNAFRPGARLLGLPIARTAGGWEFAIYERRQ